MGWYLRKADGRNFGPVELEELRAWAAEGRIGPGESVSRDLRTWAPAKDVPELEMQWVVRLPDGSDYGPLHLLALGGLVRRGVLGPLDAVRNARTGESRPAAEVLLPALVAERMERIESVDLQRAGEVSHGRQQVRALERERDESRKREAELRHRVVDLETRLRDLLRKPPTPGVPPKTERPAPQPVSATPAAGVPPPVVHVGTGPAAAGKSARPIDRALLKALSGKPSRVRAASHPGKTPGMAHWRGSREEML